MEKEEQKKVFNLFVIFSKKVEIQTCKGQLSKNRLVIWSTMNFNLKKSASRSLIRE